MLIVNFKTYKYDPTLVKKCLKLGAIPCVQPFNVVKGAWLQHVDAIEKGRNTGFISIDNAKKAGFKGTLLNHSEHRLDFKVLKKTIELCKKKRFKCCVCVESVSEASKISKLKPDYVAFELPSLIGGNKSISKSNPELISKVVKASKSIKVLAGAGIKTKEDVEVAKKLGCKGVLVASGIVKSSNPIKKIKDLL